MTLRVNIGIDWEIGGSKLDLTTIAQLLEGISETGTVRAAANKLGISYRTVWGKLEAAEAALGQQLVVKNKGHGSVLTKAGEHLKNLVAKLTKNLYISASLEQQTFENSFRNTFSSEPRKLRLACSHDIVFEDCVQAGLLPDWDIRNMGSQKAIDALRAGTVDMAGFHLLEKAASQPGMKELWTDSRFFLLPIMCRELGFVVARGNPLNIKNIEDLVRPDVIFINRQEKSGTRQRLDELLNSKQIDPKSIHGYLHEEFTHFGVVLAVAAGVANVAFALRSSTTGLAVDFVPVGKETYCVCGKIEISADARFENLLRQVSDRLCMHEGYSKPLVNPETGGNSSSNQLASVAQWVSIS
jgi:molybdate transport repressor ModE-like protein